MSFLLVLFSLIFSFNDEILTYIYVNCTETDGELYFMTGIHFIYVEVNSISDP